MMLFGVNFSVYILLIWRKFRQILRMEELWFYLGFIVVSTTIIAINILPLYRNDPAESIHQSFFYVSSIITTTGFGIGDVNHWPQLAKGIILVITFVGAMAGSTGGGFKISRLVILAKEVKKEISLLIHPRNVKSIKMDGKSVDHNITRNTSVFLVVYLAVFLASFLIVSIEGRDMITSFTSVAATLNNTGPGLNDVGPVGNYYAFTPLSKIVLIIDMLAGRLEIFPLLLLFSPSAWKKN
jgi:trk system potassium uptake protein TrkH